MILKLIFFCFLKHARGLHTFVVFVLKEKGARTLTTQTLVFSNLYSDRPAVNYLKSLDI